MELAPRHDFPLLRRTFEGRSLVYLDSAATSLKPQQVLDAEARYSVHFTANIHRGKHALSEEASDAYEGARRKVAQLIGAAPREVVFVRNTTEGLNLVASGLGLQPTDWVVVAAGEHHSNLVPWMRRAKVHIVEARPGEPVDLDAVREALKSLRPKVVTFGHASNVTGVVHPARELCALAREAGAVSVVDAAQSAPHLPLSVETLGCDFLAFSGHKMLGPTGIGVLWGRSEPLRALEPLMVGGGTVDRVREDGFTLKDVPYRLEAGTPNISGAIGLGAAADYLKALELTRVQQHEEQLAASLEQALSDLPGLRLLMARRAPRLAVATLVPSNPGVSADHLAMVLSDSHAMMLRSGFHCAHVFFDRLGVEAGSLRASAYCYNTGAEVEQLGRVLRTMAERLGLGSGGAR